VSTEKLTRKEIRHPDPFVRATSAFWAKMVEQRMAAGLTLAGVFVVFVIAALVTRFGEQKTRESGGALARALELAHRPVQGTPEAFQSDAKNTFASFKEKNEKLGEALQEVRTKFPGTAAAATATVAWGDAQFNLGKLDEAAKAYEEYLSATREGEPLRLLALEGLGYVYESKKDWDKALDSFDRMSREAAGEPNKARAALHRARVLEQSGKKVEAAAAFQKIKEEYKEAPSVRDAEERLALLAMQGIVAPAAEKDKKVEEK
jgi:tetratricopeptide (TPR) repeat protein